MSSIATIARRPLVLHNSDDGRIAASNFKSLPSGYYSTSITLTVEY